MDLGDCQKHHDLALRADFELASKKKDYYYDIDVSSVSFLYKQTVEEKNCFGYSL